jgi:hypothetical protein
MQNLITITVCLAGNVFICENGLAVTSGRKISRVCTTTTLIDITIIINLS